MKLLLPFAQARCFQLSLPAAARAWLLVALLTCRWSTACAQVTTYTDEGTFTAATAKLSFITESFEGLAPTAGEVQISALSGSQAEVPALPSGLVIYNTTPVGSDPIYVADGAYANGNLSLNGSASFVDDNDSVNVPTTTISFPKGATTAFGMRIGSLDPNGTDIAYGDDPTTGTEKVYHYPLTDTIDVQLYSDGSPVGSVYHAGTVADGFVGFVSTVPFDTVTITFVLNGSLYDGSGYVIDNPYKLVLDNVRFNTIAVSTYSLYVADVGTGVIYGYTAAGVQGTFATGLSAPAALAFDTSGNLYEGDAGTGIIYKAAANGVQTIFASGFAQIYGLACDASGNVFAASVANNVGSITKITPAGVQSTFASGLTRVQGLAFDAAGNLYEAEFDTGSVYKFTPAGVKSTFAAGINKPTGLTFDARGNLFVCSQGGGIFKVTPTGVVSTFTTNVTDPRYLAFDSSGNLYVTDVGNFSGAAGQGNVYLFTPAGARTTYASGLAAPFGIALNPIPTTASHPGFFTGETALSNGVYYLSFPNGNYFGYYSFLSDSRYLYHFDLGYEYVFDAADGKAGVYFYDFASSTFFYTSPTFPFPYLYDFSLNTVLYYYPDPNDPGRYNTDGVRYFYDFATGKIITK